MSVDLSFVIPLYNEQDSLALLHEQITNAASACNKCFEIIFVNDGSTDQSLQVLNELKKKDNRIKLISFRRNFGKASALDAGFEQATGNIIFTLDADLQDDPAELPNFLSRLDEGYDVVSGWKKIRHDPVHKVFPSRVFNALVSWKTGVRLHDHNCGYKAYRREVLQHIRLYGERHRFVPVLAACEGFNVGEVVIKHRPRNFGQSKYGWNRFLRGFLDLQAVSFLTQYRYRPMHYFGTRSLLLALIGVFSGILAYSIGFNFLGTLLSVMCMVTLSASIPVYYLGITAEANLDRNPPKTRAGL